MALLITPAPRPNVAPPTAPPRNTPRSKMAR